MDQPLARFPVLRVDIVQYTCIGTVQMEAVLFCIVLIYISRLQIEWICSLL